MKFISCLQVGMRLKKKSQEAKVEVRKKSQEEDQVRVENNIHIYREKYKI